MIPFRKKKNQYEFKDRKSIGGFLGAPIQFFMSLLGGKDRELGHSIGPVKRAINGLVFLIKFPFWLIFQALIFLFTSWTSTRDGNAAFWGVIPAIGIGAVFGTLITANILEDRWTKRFHRQRVIDALETNQPEIALLCSSRVQKINHDDPFQYAHAETLLRVGKVDNALVLVRELASPDRPGHIDSHLLLAKELIGRRGTEEEKKESLQLAKKHLQRILDIEPTNFSTQTSARSSGGSRRKMAISRDAYIRLGDVHFELGELEEAMAIYEKVTKIAPQVVPRLAQYLIDDGRIGDAQNHVRSGVESLRRTLESDPNQEQLWEQLYEILMVTNNHQAALDQLNSAMKQTTDLKVQKNIRRLQSNVLLGFSRLNSSLTSRDDFRRKLILVCRAIQVFPRNGDALGEWISLVVFPESSDMESWINDEARDNVAPSIYHVIHGVRDAIKGKPLTSQEHFKLAFNNDPRTAIIINDIAFMMALEKDRPEEAMLLINRAIECWNSAKLYQTRGEILMSQGKYEQALPELEYAASVIKKDYRVFLVLADCYRKLGREDDAQKQEELAKLEYKDTFNVEGQLIRRGDSPLKESPYGSSEKQDRTSPRTESEDQ